MNSTRTSKSRDATSLHPVTKSCPFDLSTAPQSYAHLLLSLPKTKQTPRVSIFHYSQPLQYFTLRRIQIQKDRVAGDFVLTGGVVLVSGGSNQGSGESTAGEKERKRKSFLKVVFLFPSLLVLLCLCAQRERERVRRKKKNEK